VFGEKFVHAPDLRFARASAFLLGFFTIASQSALLREYLVLFRGSELSIGLFFCAWFLAISFGAYLSSRVRDAGSRVVAILLAIYPFAGIAALASIPFVKHVFGVPFFETPSWQSMAVGAITTSAPVSLITGFAFPLTSNLLSDDRVWGASSAYLIESAGAVLGGVLATLFYALGLDNQLVVAIVGLPLALLAFVFRSGCVRFVGFASLFVMILVAILSPTTQILSRLRLHSAMKDAEFVDEFHTPYQVLTVARTGSQVGVLSDGNLDFTVPIGFEVEANAAILASICDEHKKAVLIGQGAYPMALALTQYFSEVELLVLDDMFISALQSAQENLGLPLQGATKVNVIVADPRHYLKGMAEQASLIVVASGEPSSLLANRFYTLDFFDEVKGKLRDTGVIVVPIRSSDIHLTTELLRLGQSVYKTLEAVFKEVTVAPGDPALMIAGKTMQKTPLDPATLSKRYELIAPKDAKVPKDAFVSLLPPDRVAFFGNLYSRDASEELINRDSKPIAPFLYILSLLKQQESQFSLLLFRLHGASGFLLVGVALLLLLVLLRRRLVSDEDTFAGSVMIAMVGGSSITATILFLALFQSSVGALYGEVGLASAITMIGLTLGSFFGRFVVSSSFGKRNPHLLAVAFCAVSATSMVLLAMFTPETSLLDATRARLVFGFALLFVGIGTGFAWPSAASIIRSSNVANTLEAKDHLGAAIFSLFGGVFVFAIFGFTPTLLFLAFMFIVSALVLVWDVWLKRTAPSQHPFLRHFSFRSFSHYSTLGGVFLFLGFLSLLVYHLSSPAKESEKTVLSQKDLSKLEEFQDALFRTSPFPHHVLHGCGGGECYAVASQAVANDVKGYGGPFNLAISLGPDGLIRRVQVISHNETPSYITGLDTFLSAFQGKDAKKPIVIDDVRALDAMTGATVTKKAFQSAIEKSAQTLARDVLGLQIETETQKPSAWSLLLSWRVLFVVLASLWALLVYYLGSYTIRLAFLVGILVFGGFVFNIQLSSSWLLMLFSFNIPSFSANPELFLFTIVPLAFAVLIGPLYCSFLCPFGALQEVIGKVSSAFGLLSKPSETLSDATRPIKYLLLLLVLLALFSKDPHGSLSFDPLETAFSGSLSGIALALVVVVLVASAISFRFWCRYFCPVGAFFLLFNRVAKLIGIATRKRYSQCDLGVKGIYDIECMECNRCRREIPKTAKPVGEGQG
jgi:predicted membrane-bound spermidine synthase/Na+-translocating ferredoxin:NAD+ oxidoreductase RnfG subunit